MKQKTPEDELDQDQLEDAAGGFLERFPNVPLEELKTKRKDSGTGTGGSGGEDR